MSSENGYKDFHVSMPIMSLRAVRVIKRLFFMIIMNRFIIMTCIINFWNSLNCPEKDTSTVDLARGNFLSYDPNLWKNPNPQPFHFVPSTLSLLYLIL